jgi:DNA replication protein DnaC
MCALCDDTGWKPIAADGVRRVVRCDCWREVSSNRSLAESGIPPRYRRCDLETFRDYNDSLVIAVNRAKRLVEEFPVVDKGILFVGQPGIGKTHLAVSILRKIIERTGAQARFFDTRHLLATIRNTYNPVVKTTEASVIRPAMDAELLVLDDLGAERPTEWVEETMNLIINTRYNMKRATVITTNYPLRSPSKAHVETLGERIGARIYSRLFEMCDFVEMNGVHYRELGRDASLTDIAELDKDGSQLNKDLGTSSGTSSARRTRPMLKVKLGPEKELGWSGGKAGN